MLNWKEECFQLICGLISESVWVGDTQIFIPNHSLILLLKDLSNPIGINNHPEKKKFVIWEDDWFHSKEKILAQLQSLLKKNQRIFARNTQILTIEKKEAGLFLDRYHLLKSCKAQIYIGLRYQQNLVAVACFSKPKLFEYQNQPILSYELSRYVCVAGTTIVGGLSRLIQYFVSLYSPCHLMTYVDCERSNGENFEKIGFERICRTAPITFYVEKETMLRKPMKKNAVFDSNTAFYIISNEGNYKFSAYFV